MKRKLFFITVIQILVITGFYFLLSILMSDDSWQVYLIQSIVFSLFYFFLFPKIYKLFLMVKATKEHKSLPDEKLLFETKVYIIGIAFPEKVTLKITNKNLIYNLYREDKVIALSEVNAVNFKNDNITFHYNYGTKKAKINFITDQAKEISESIPKSYQFNDLISH